MAETELPSDPGARRVIGRLLGVGILGAAAIAVVVTLLQWDTRPQTDDATVRANFVGIAPQVSGHIVEFRVRDNQKVQEGDLLFLIDPRPYEIALERARATLALTRKEVDSLKNGAASAMAGVSTGRGPAQRLCGRGHPPGDGSGCGRRGDRPPGGTARRGGCKPSGAPRRSSRTADDHVKRLEPLLPQQFVTADRVEEARTRRTSAAMRVEQGRTGVQAALAALDEARARKTRAVASVSVHARPTCCHRGGAATGPQRAVSRRGCHRPDRGYQCPDSRG